MLRVPKRYIWKVYVIIVITVFAFLLWWTDPRITPSGTLQIYDRYDTLLYEQAGNIGRKQVVAQNTLPHSAIDAVVSIEDARFYEHGGIDVIAMLRAGKDNVIKGTIVSGASTITQQLARLVVLREPSSSNIWIRKMREVLVAVRLSLLYSKVAVITMYLNEVYLGNNNYGFGTASHEYFHKEVSKLSIAESAYLAGMIASPAKYDPFTKKKDGVTRMKKVLKAMKEQNYISKEQYHDALGEQLTFSPVSYRIIAPHFVDYVMQQLAEMNLPLTNVSVYTTFDTPAYEQALSIAREKIHALSEQHNVHNASLVLLENTSGAIRVMVGGVEYNANEKDGQVNVATSKRQPGSAIKPITYFAGFLNDITPATLLYDVRKPFITSQGKGFIPNNYGDRYHGLVLVREALASSYNMPAVDVFQKVGSEEFLRVAHGLGIESYPHTGQYDYALTLGAHEVSLLELSNAYGSFARGGEYVKPYAIELVKNAQGKTIYTHRKQSSENRIGNRAKQASYVISHILSDPLARMPGFGEKNPLVLSRPVAVKTGTTTDWHDVWTVGYTPSYTLGVWMGNTDNSAMEHITSAQSAGAIWNSVFEQWLVDKPVEAFIRPAGLVDVEICALTGLLPDGLCPERKHELFIDGTQPKEKSSLHMLVRTDTRNGLLANETCPSNYVATKLMIRYPEEVYSWAVAEGKTIIPETYSPLCAVGSSSQTQSVAPMVEIVNPRDKARFKSAPELIRHEGIAFDVRVSSSIESVEWYVDGKKWKQSSTAPFTVFYHLQKGIHTVYAVGIAPNGSTPSQTVTFEVVEN